MNKTTVMVEQTRVQLANRQRVLMICPDDAFADRVLDMLFADTLPDGPRKEISLSFDNGARITIRVVNPRRKTGSEPPPIDVLATEVAATAPSDKKDG